MSSPRWKKLLRDLQATQGRMVMIVVAIAVSIFGVGTILSAYTILTREISRNYLGTNPASAFLELDRVDDALVEAVRQQPNIAEAEAGSWVVARVEAKPNEWLPLLLFVIKDFNTMRINTFLPEAEKALHAEDRRLSMIQVCPGCGKKQEHTGVDCLFCGVSLKGARHVG